MKKRKRKLRTDRMIIVFFAFVLIVISVFTIIKLLFFPSVYYNYSYNKVNDLAELTLHDYDWTKLDNSSPYYHYEDDKYRSLVGIDISSHQEDVDFKKVKDSGVDFVYLRLGYRGYVNGKISIDKYFETNYKNAKEAGLQVGVYFFSQAIDEKEAMEEAFFTLENIVNKKIDLPIVYDLEEIDYDDSRIKDISGEQRSNNAMSFIQKVTENGYEGMIYTNLYWSTEFFDLHQILNYDIWFAQYSDEPDFIYPFKIWQYSDNGIVDGINYPVDLNIMFIEK